MTTKKTTPKPAPDAAEALAQRLADAAEAKWQQSRAEAWAERVDWVEAIKPYRAVWDAEEQLRFDRENLELRERGDHAEADRRTFERTARRELDDQTRRVRSATSTSAHRVGRTSAAPAPWEPVAQERARAFVDKQRAEDLYPSQLQIGEEVARQFRAEQIYGVDGKPLTGSYIKRHALKGISSARGKARSTTRRQGK